MASEKQTCPLCGERVDRLVYSFHRASEDQIIRKIRERHPDWSEKDGACPRCVDHYHVEILNEKRILPEIGPHFPVRTVDDYVVIPTPLRMNADPRYTGQGVTICMIDSGFYPHPDLVKPVKRVLEMKDLGHPERKGAYFSKPHDESWHGTMTSVACGGNGFLSEGLYRGIASGANFVLLKVMDEGGISPESVTRAVNWAVQHKDRLGIRIINLSLSAGWPSSYKDSPVDDAVEDAIRAGIVVVAAVGNEPGSPVKPPANSPNVIAVGGVDDHNALDTLDPTAYPSTHGTTADAIMKPEIAAPGIWVAAPILPGSLNQLESRLLHEILEAGPGKRKSLLKEQIAKTKIDPRVLDEKSDKAILSAVKDRISQAKYISSHYMHVDGTSFAAPIVSSIIAQMLEANPNLIPRIVREILFTTARKVDTIPVEQQGHGVVDAAAAVQRAEKEYSDFTRRRLSPFLDKTNQRIVFYLHSKAAQKVTLAGSFNGWSRGDIRMRREARGTWVAEIPMLAPGTYQYKFIVDGDKWIDDPENPHRENDGMNGLNSKLFVV